MESGLCRENVDQTHLAPASGKLVLQQLLGLKLQDTKKLYLKKKSSYLPGPTRKSRFVFYFDIWIIEARLTKTNFPADKFFFIVVSAENNLRPAAAAARNDPEQPWWGPASEMSPFFLLRGEVIVNYETVYPKPVQTGFMIQPADPETRLKTGAKDRSSTPKVTKEKQSQPLFHSHYLPLSLSHDLSVSHSLCLSLSLCLTLSVSFHTSHSLSFSLFLWPSLTFCGSSKRRTSFTFSSACVRECVV